MALRLVKGNRVAPTPTPTRPQALADKLDLRKVATYTCLNSLCAHVWTAPVVEPTPACPKCYRWSVIADDIRFDKTTRV